MSALALVEWLLREGGDDLSLFHKSHEGRAVNVCVAARDPTTAIKILRLLEARKHPIMCATVISYNSAISACKNAGDADRALELLSELKLHATLQPDDISYNAAISACEKAGHAAHALELLAELEQHPTLQPSVISYSAVISACGKAGDTDRALELLAHLKHSVLTLRGHELGGKT